MTSGPGGDFRRRGPPTVVDAFSSDRTSNLPFAHGRWNISTSSTSTSSIQTVELEAPHAARGFAAAEMDGDSRALSRIA